MSSAPHIEDQWHSQRLHKCKIWSKLTAAAVLLVACASSLQAAAQSPGVDSRMSAAQMARALANLNASGLLQQEAEKQGWGDRGALMGCAACYALFTRASACQCDLSAHQSAYQSVSRYCWLMSSASGLPSGMTGLSHSAWLGPHYHRQ
jgi:hypothetical protein